MASSRDGATPTSGLTLNNGGDILISRVPGGRFLDHGVDSSPTPSSPDQGNDPVEPRRRVYRRRCSKLSLSPVTAPSRPGTNYDLM